jgi:hypothetical protein
VSKGTPITDESWIETIREATFEAATEGDDQSPIGCFWKIDSFGRPMVARQDSFGIFSTSAFDTEEERDRYFQDLLNAYWQWDAEVSDEDLVAAINGFREALLFTADQTWPDDVVPSWSAAAQQQIIDEVTEFVTSNAPEIREFLDATGHEWTQVGIDFAFTRNHEGAGFWDRGAGEPGKVLTEMSHPWGEVRAVLGDDEEMVIE